jgi:hypothetical protein
MPLNPSPRLPDFDAALRRAGIPIDGVSWVGPGLSDVTIQFQVTATQEQHDQAEQLRQTFDWRPRRALTRAQIVAGIGNLTSAQQTALLRHLLAVVCREHLNELADVLAVTGLPLAVDEVVP